MKKLLSACYLHTFDLGTFTYFWAVGDIETIKRQGLIKIEATQLKR